jgi:hypothetical protein
MRLPRGVIETDGRERYSIVLVGPSPVPAHWIPGWVAVGHCCPFHRTGGVTVDCQKAWWVQDIGWDVIEDANPHEGHAEF